MPRIQDAKILIIATNGFEQSELEVPRDELAKAGAEVHVASTDGKAIRGWKGSDWADTVNVDTALNKVSAMDYDALVLPGGLINPDILRRDKDAISLIKGFFDQGKVIAAICHAPWLLAEADVLRGLEATSYPSLRTDIANAGAKVVDQSAVADRGIVTSRNPDDLPDFVAKIIEEIEEGTHYRVAA